MKKLIALLAVMVMAVGQISARDRIYRTVEPLPTAAKTTLKSTFPKTQVSHVKVDKHVFGGTEYDVIMVDGSEVEFNSNGEWTEVDCGNNPVPSKFIPKAIANYVAKNFRGQRVVQIKKERNKYDVELSSGIELEFDRAGNFLRMDD